MYMYQNIHQIRIALTAIRDKMAHSCSEYVVQTLVCSSMSSKNLLLDEVDIQLTCLDGHVEILGKIKVIRVNEGTCLIGPNSQISWADSLSLCYANKLKAI